MADILFSNKYERKYFVSPINTGAQKSTEFQQNLVTLSQVIPNDVDTPVMYQDLNAINYVLAGGQFTFLQQGIYSLQVTTSWDNTGLTNGVRGHYMVFNGDFLKKLGYVRSSAAGTGGPGSGAMTTSSSVTFKVAAGNSLVVHCFQNSGSPLNLLTTFNGNSMASQIAVVKIASIQD